MLKYIDLSDFTVLFKNITVLIIAVKVHYCKIVLCIYDGLRHS